MLPRIFSRALGLKDFLGLLFLWSYVVRQVTLFWPVLITDHSHKKPKSLTIFQDSNILLTSVKLTTLWCRVRQDVMFLTW